MLAWQYSLIERSWHSRHSCRGGACLEHRDILLATAAVHTALDVVVMLPWIHGATSMLMLTTLRPDCAFDHCHFPGSHSVAAALSSRATTVVFLIMLWIRVLSQVTVSEFKLRDHRVARSFRGSLGIRSDLIFSLIRWRILLSHYHLLLI